MNISYIRRILGIDKVSHLPVSSRFGYYSFNACCAWQSFVTTLPGTGPRHIVFHPQLPYAYLIEEMGGAVSVYSYKNGRLSPLQHISSHPADFKGKKGSADIHLSPDGRFLYASNRGDANSIAIYAVNVNNGKLLLKGFESTQGVAPRNFVIDPTGNYLLVANQDSNNIV